MIKAGRVAWMHLQCQGLGGLIQCLYLPDLSSSLGIGGDSVTSSWDWRREGDEF